MAKIDLDLSEIPEHIKRNLDGETLRLIGKLRKRHEAIISRSPSSSIASLNPQGENVAREIHKLFLSGTDPKTSMDCIRKIFPNLPKKKLMTLYHTFLIIKGRGLIGSKLP